MYIVEQFHSIQGEGRTIGRSAYFVRFAGCNLNCVWCDSKHATDPKIYKSKLQKLDFKDIPDNCNLIVFTGGEPTLYNLLEVKNSLICPGREFEVETNGVNFPDYVDEFNWNVSFKLLTSCQPQENFGKRLSNVPTWAEYARLPERKNHVIFKFVVSSQDDVRELLFITKNFLIPRNLIYVMPEAINKEDLELGKVDWIIDFAKREGLNFTPRLHVMLWGNKKGV